MKINNPPKKQIKKNDAPEESREILQILLETMVLFQGELTELLNEIKETLIKIEINTRKETRGRPKTEK
jgi:hypothetical protein